MSNSVTLLEALVAVWERLGMPLKDRAIAAEGASVVVTYGMTETTGTPSLPSESVVISSDSITSGAQLLTFTSM